MRVLLDTHAMYWYIEGDPLLSPTAQSVIRDASNEVLISPGSYWEIAIKVSLNKWRLNRPYREFIDVALNQYGFQILPILPNHTAAVATMPFHHRDLFDRLIAAQALVEQIAVVSNDPALDPYGISRLW